MKILLGILLLSVFADAQNKPISIVDTFLLYPNSVAHVERQVLFSGRTILKRGFELTNYLANCDKRSYIVLNWYRKLGGRDSYSPKLSQKITQATTDSPIWKTLDLICTKNNV